MVDFNTSAVTPAADTIGTVAPAAKKVASGKNDLVEVGNQILMGLSEDQRAVLGSKSNTVAFVAVLGNPFVKAKRRAGSEKENGVVVKNENNKPIGIDLDCSSPVGFLFKALTEAVEVPVISGKFTTKNGCSHKDIGTKTVQAGQYFPLTPLEAFVFAIREEYSLNFARIKKNADGNDEVIDNAFTLVLRTNSETKNGKVAAPAVFPTPTPSYNDPGAEAPKSMIRDICASAYGADGKPVWADTDANGYSAYAEKFGFIFEKAAKAKIAREGGATPKKKKDDTKAAAAACRQLLNAQG